MYLTDFLVCIVNNDDQVKLKGSVPFMDEEHRCFIMSKFRDVDWAIVSFDYDKTVCESIRVVEDEFKYESIVDGKKNTLKFFNSGDRVKNPESAEVKVCDELGIEYVTLPLPKVSSSSELIKKASIKV